jgi:hypothetical protein
VVMKRGPCVVLDQGLCGRRSRSVRGTRAVIVSSASLSVIVT